ncbi:MAG: hypothetical protein COA52_00340 [Hyphomicrobiales bacterium]|nr:MAG: hypothetical protein COA52_00340 [Hyphomicrobiales bacterium]
MVLEKTPLVEFFGKSISIPSISIAPIDRSTQFTTLKEQGDTIQFSQLDVTFRIDEQLLNYKEIFDWMVSIGFPEDFTQYGNPRGISTMKNVLVSDIDILLFSSKNNPLHRFTFVGAWPTDLSGISINIDDESIIYTECTVSFAYDTFSLGEP